MSLRLVGACSFSLKETHALTAVVAPKAADLKEAVGALELLLILSNKRDSGAPPVRQLRRAPGGPSL